VPVLLDGQGADEVLAGYHYHYGPYLAGVAARRGWRRRWARPARARRATGRPWSFFLGLLAYHSVPLPAALRARAVRGAATQGRVPPALVSREFGAHAGGASQRHRPRTDLHSELRGGLQATSLPPSSATKTATRWPSRWRRACRSSTIAWWSARRPCRPPP
jgi:hypothetical protein